MRKPQLFAPENHPARSICGIKLAHNLAHKNVQNVQLKQWMQYMQCEFFLGNLVVPTKNPIRRKSLKLATLAVNVARL
jgi:hypothetical protein